MSVEPILDIAALTAPIAGSDPAGGCTPFAIRQQLDDARREVDPAAFAADDPIRPTEFKHADWALILRLSQDTLKSTAKDLLVAARLTEAATKIHGFLGLRDGLKLFRALVTDCWDRLAPKLDDPTDLEIRAAPLEWLGDADHGALFPGSVRLIPIVGTDATAFGWIEWKRAIDSKDRSRYEAFEKAVAAAAPEQVRDTLALIDECARELDGLVADLAGRLEALAPSLTGLRAAIADCRTLLGQIADRKSPTAPLVATTTTTPSGGSGATLSIPNGGGMETREAIYRTLSEAAATLARLEPHSPIPYLIQRCVELGNLSFPDMIRSFVRDEGMVKEIERELGIPPRTSAESS